MTKFETLVVNVAEMYLFTVVGMIVFLTLVGLLYEAQLTIAIYEGIRIGAVMGTAISLAMMILIPMQNYVIYGTWCSKA